MKGNWLRRLSCVAVGVFLMVGLIACGKSPSQSNQATPAQPEPSAKTEPQAKKFAGQTLRVAMFGGTWNENRKKTLIKRLEDETGAKVEYVFGVDNEHVAKLVAGKGQEPPFDVVELGLFGAVRMSKLAVVEQLDPNRIPNLKDLPPNVVYPDRVAWQTLEVGIGYNPTKFKELGLPAPTTWEDLFNPKLAGRVSVGPLGHGFIQNTLVGLAMHNGGDLTSIKPGFEKLSQLKLESVYSSSADLGTKFSRGEVWAAVTYAGLVARFKDSGTDLAFANIPVQDKNTYAIDDYLLIPKGTKLKELAEYYVNLALDPQVATDWTKLMWTNPTNPKAQEMVKKEPKLSTMLGDRPYIARNATEIYRLDYGYVVDKTDEWQDLWNRMIAK